MKRREFLRAATVSGLVSPILLDAHTELPKRRYKDDVKLSTIGFGGIIMMDLEQDHANHVVADAIERGVNYFDVAPSYGNGEAEEKLGIALERRRENVFLACKAEKRDAEGAREQLETSLRRLMLAIMRKRVFLKISRRVLGSIVELEAKVVQVAVG
jgi:predicted aldo/keto reductase-like oxidoreductase